MRANAVSYARWGFLMHGPIWIGGVLVALARCRENTARATALAAAIGAALPYAFYRTYDHWETQRFILPLLVVGTMLAVIGLMSGARRLLGDRAGTWAALFLTIALAWSWARWLEREQVLGLHAPRSASRRPAGRTRDSPMRSFSRRCTRQPALLRTSADDRLGKDSSRHFEATVPRAAASRTAGVPADDGKTNARSSSHVTEASSTIALPPSGTAGTFSCSRLPCGDHSSSGSRRHYINSPASAAPSCRAGAPAPRPDRRFGPCAPARTG